MLVVVANRTLGRPGAAQSRVRHVQSKTLRKAYHRVVERDTFRTCHRKDSGHATWQENGDLFAASALVTTWTGASSPAASAGSADPVAVYGDLPAGATGVTLTVLPSRDAVQSGERIELPPLEDADIRIGDGSFTASVDPVDIPVSNIQAEGVVDFRVDVTGVNDQHWVSVVSSRTVWMPDADGPSWVDPVDSAHAVATSMRAARRSGVTSGNIPHLRGARDDDGGTTEPEFEDDGTSTTTYAESTCHVQYTTPTGETTIRPTTLGTTYPIGETTARMVVDSSEGAKYGAAVQTLGRVGFSAAGEMFTRSDWGKSWNLTHEQRSYRKGVEYRKTIYRCTDEHHNYWDEPWWLPTGETGETGHNDGITRPSWNTYCAAQDAGQWWRKGSSGSSYKFGAAVKFAGVIGIDLSITRDYSANQKIEYDIVGNKTKLCGNTGYPSTAGKIIQRLK
jgi:hypothetical protein